MRSVTTRRRFETPAGRPGSEVCFLLQMSRPHHAKRIFTGGQSAIGVEFLGCRSFTSPHARTRTRSKRYRRAEAGIKIVVAECFLQRREGGLAGAVARRNGLDLELVMQRGHDPCD